MRHAMLYVGAWVLALSPSLTAQNSSESTPATEPVNVNPSEEVHELQFVAPAESDASDLPEGQMSVLYNDGTGEPKTVWFHIGKDGQPLSRVLADAIEFNPDIEAARAELKAAEARVRQLEMKTATDVIRYQREIEELTKRLDAQRALVDKEFAKKDELIPLETELEARKSELNFLSGRQFKILGGDDAQPMLFTPGRPGSVEHIDTLQLINASTARPGIDDSTPERLRTALDQSVSILFVETSIADVVDFISETYDVNLSIDVTLRGMLIDTNIRDVPLQHALLSIADAYDLVFVIREYGVFVTTPERARSIPGPTIPEDVPFATAGKRRYHYVEEIPLIGRFDRGIPDAKTDSPMGKEVEERVRRMKYDKVDQVRTQLNRGEVEIVPPQVDPNRDN